MASTAIRPIHQVMWNNWWPRMMTTTPSTANPPRNQEPGTSMRSIGSPLPARLRKNAVRVPKARTTVRHCRKNTRSPEVTIMGTPIHRLHDEIRRSADPPLVAMMPASIMIGASTM